MEKNFKCWPEGVYKTLDYPEVPIFEVLRSAAKRWPWRIAIIFAGMERIRPIAMTTATTVLGLLPMALDRSQGASLWSPLAITVISGLLSSTMLTLLIVPSFYIIFTDFGRLFRRKKRA